MKPLPTLMIALASGLTLSACALNGSTKPLVTPAAEPPAECRIPCGAPPALQPPRQVWETEILRWGAACAALHADCVAGLKQE